VLVRLLGPEILKCPNIRLFQNLEALTIDRKVGQFLDQLLQQIGQLVVVAFHAQLVNNK